MADGWFGGGECPGNGLPRDADVLTEQDLEGLHGGARPQRLLRAGLVVHESRGQRRRYAKRSVNGAASSPCRCCSCGAYDTTCETMTSRLPEPMRRGCADLTEVVVQSGHWMAQEQPVAVNAALAKWLAAKLPPTTGRATCVPYRCPVGDRGLRGRAAVARASARQSPANPRPRRRRRSLLCRPQHDGAAARSRKPSPCLLSPRWRPAAALCRSSKMSNACLAPSPGRQPGGSTSRSPTASGAAPPAA